MDYRITRFLSQKVDIQNRKSFKHELMRFKNFGANRSLRKILLYYLLFMYKYFSNTQDSSIRIYFSANILNFSQILFIFLFYSSLKFFLFSSIFFHTYLNFFSDILKFGKRFFSDFQLFIRFSLNVSLHLKFLFSSKFRPQMKNFGQIEDFLPLQNFRPR